MATPPVYGLEITPGDKLTSGSDLLPYGFHITMAAIDPSETPLPNEQGKIPAVSRATLRIIRPVLDDTMGDDSDDDDDVAQLRALLAEASEGDSDDESNGGPSDLNKAKKQKAQAALKKLLESTQDEGSDEDDESDEDEVLQDAKSSGKAKSKANGAQSSKKGKEKALEMDEDSDEDDEGSDEDYDDTDLEQFVICTLDSEKTYQQPLDLTIGAEDKVFFSVSGNHTVYLTGNYIFPHEHEHDDDSDDEDYGEGGYDLDPNEIDDDEDSGDESDELDGLGDPRIVEIESEEEKVAPKLVDTKSKKGKKRPAEDDAHDLDELITKETKTAEPKISKKQQKKLKNNQGEAVAAEGKPAPQTPKDSAKSDKKVQFAKQLEQGPTGSAEKAKQASAEKPKKASTDEPKQTPTVKERDGVLIDDRTVGNGRVVKSGDKVSVRYIGRLANGSVFDANKKGKPFSFTVGKGEVIKGWDSGLVGMAPGGERRLTIPPKMAYGSRRMGDIPANSTLKFDVKLLEIK